MKNYQEREFSRTSVCPKGDVSIDPVDMIVKLKEMTGKTVKSEDFKTARTTSDVVESVYNMLM